MAMVFSAERPRKWPSGQNETNRGTKSRHQIEAPNRGTKSRHQIEAPNRGTKSRHQIEAPNRGTKSRHQIEVKTLKEYPRNLGNPPLPRARVRAFYRRKIGPVV